jgi:hypothetical protein
MNHAAELYTGDAVKGAMQQFTVVNDYTYKSSTSPKWNDARSAQQRIKKMIAWIIYPP